MALVQRVEAAGHENSAVPGCIDDDLPVAILDSLYLALYQGLKRVPKLIHTFLGTSRYAVSSFCALDQDKSMCTATCLLHKLFHGKGAVWTNMHL